jgi:hypothetical protein
VAILTESSLRRIMLCQSRGAPLPEYYQWHRVLLAYRLGHLGTLVWPGGGGTPTLVCWMCGPITGPAEGVTEHKDGSLTWTRADDTEVRVPPVTWIPDGWSPPPAPRPTMPVPAVGR